MTVQSLPRTCFGDDIYVSVTIFMKLENVKIKKPEDVNFIFGQAHFIKTVEDLYEVLVGAVPGIKFGLSFCESSGPRKIRTAGTDEKLIKLAEAAAKAVGCGHTFFIFLANSYPINVLNAIKMVPEVATLFAATANPLEVIVARTKNGGGVLGVVDGLSPQGVETKEEARCRWEFLRKIGYKL